MEELFNKFYKLLLIVLYVSIGSMTTSTIGASIGVSIGVTSEFFLTEYSLLNFS